MDVCKLVPLLLELLELGMVWDKEVCQCGISCADFYHLTCCSGGSRKTVWIQKFWFKLTICYVKTCNICHIAHSYRDMLFSRSIDHNFLLETAKISYYMLCQLCAFTVGWSFSIYGTNHMREFGVVCDAFQAWSKSSRSFDYDLVTKTAKILDICRFLVCDIYSSG